MKRKNGGDRRIVSELRLVRCLTKYGIVCMAALIGLHNVMVLMGTDNRFLHQMLTCFTLALVWKLSKLFRLCLQHRLCVIYVGATCATLTHVAQMGASQASHAIQLVLIVSGVLIPLTSLVCEDKKN